MCHHTAWPHSVSARRDCLCPLSQDETKSKKDKKDNDKRKKSAEEGDDAKKKEKKEKKKKKKRKDDGGSDDDDEVPAGFANRTPAGMDDNAGFYSD